MFRILPSALGVTIPQYDNAGIGMRVPNLCIGPYCRNQVLHTFMTPDSITRFIEETFLTNPAFPTAHLSPRDLNANSASAFIDLNQKPIQALVSVPSPTKLGVKKATPDHEAEIQDVVTAVDWAARHLFPHREEKNDVDDKTPELARTRPCETGYVPESGIYNNQELSLCVWHGLRDGNILLPGQVEGDNDAPDTNRKRR